MTSQQVSKLSAWLAAISTAMVVAVVLLNLWGWINPAEALKRHMMFNDVLASGRVDLAHVAWWQMLAGAVISSIPLMALGKAFWCSRQLFLAFSRKIYFSAQTALYMSKVAKCIVLWVVLDLISMPILTVLLTLQEPKGHRMISLTFGSPDLVALYLAGCIAVIAHVLSQAHTVEQENQQFI